MALEIPMTVMNYTTFGKLMKLAFAVAMVENIWTDLGTHSLNATVNGHRIQLYISGEYGPRSIEYPYQSNCTWIIDATGWDVPIEAESSGFTINLNESNGVQVRLGGRSMRGMVVFSGGSLVCIVTINGNQIHVAGLRGSAIPTQTVEDTTSIDFYLHTMFVDHPDLFRFTSQQ